MNRFLYDQARQEAPRVLVARRGRGPSPRACVGDEMMSRRSVPRSPSARCRPDRDPEAIALRVHQIAATASVVAAGQEAPLSHALYLIEASLLDVEERVGRLRRLSR